jgi:hypothetical protein
MVDLVEALKMERDYRFNIKQADTNMENSSEETLAKY